MKPRLEKRSADIRPGLVNLALAVLTPLLVFGTCEGLARFYVGQSVGWDRQAYELRQRQLSGQVGFLYRRPDVHQIIHPLGCKKSRWSNLTPTRVPGDKPQYRILVLGGSGVAGSEEKVGGDFPDVVEQMLAHYNPDFRFVVVNGGVWSGNSAMERMQLYHLRHYGWDLVIIYSGWNDLYAYSMKREKYLNDLSRTQRRLGHIGRFWFGLRERSMAVALLAHAVARAPIQLGAPVDRFDARVPLDPAHQQEFLDGVTRQTEPTLRLAQDMGVPLLFLLQSSATYTRQFRPLTDMEEKILQAFLGSHKAYWTDVMHYFYPALDARLRTLCGQYGARYINFNTLSHPYHVLYYDDLHYAMAGMQKAGILVAEIVQTEYLHRSTAEWIHFPPP